MKSLFVFSTLCMLFFACDKDDEKTSIPAMPHFEGRQEVTVTGYTDHLMEPFLSRDGDILLFNNYNAAANTNIHWATRTNDATFEYQGEVTNVNSESLDGVPSMDADGKLYFVSLRDYALTLGTVFSSSFENGTVNTITPLDQISKYVPGWVNFDVEIDAAGETMYFADGRYDEAGGPYEADLVIAKKVNGSFERLSNSATLLANVNTVDLEYAACISADDLELYFTRVTAPLTSASTPHIFVATRATTSEPFGVPVQIESITGFAEGPTISPDGHLLYYHTMDTDGKFSLYYTTRKH